MFKMNITNTEYRLLRKSQVSQCESGQRNVQYKNCAGTIQTACLLHQYARNVDHIHADNR